MQKYLFALCLISLLSFKVTAVELVVTQGDQKAKYENGEVNANKLGISLDSYVRLGHVANQSEEYHAIPSLKVLDTHPAMVQLYIATQNLERPPEALLDELSALMRSNYALAAQYVGVAQEDFYPLLVAYIQLNDVLASPSEDASNNDLRSAMTLKSLSSDDSDEEEEVVEVLPVSEDSLQELVGGGSENMWRRWHRNASNRWGSGSGTTIGVFTSGSFTYIRPYYYNNGITTAGTGQCVGMCTLRPQA